jgi:hypothetical protein
MNKLFFFAVIFLSACTSMNKVESTHEKNLIKNEYTYSDPDSQIRYDITNDSKNIHIRLNTADFATISKILRTGLKICFDVNGKKSSKVYFEYPLAQERQPMGEGEGRTRPTGANSAMGFNLGKMIDQISNEGEFDRNGTKERVLVLSNDSDIKASIRDLSSSEIIYDLVMPISRISKDGIAALSKLSVGIVTGKTENGGGSSSAGRSGSGGGGGRGGMGGGGGRGGMGGGGGRGGMGGGGGRGGMSGGEGGSGGMDRSSQAKPVDFWFKLDLQK